MIGVSYEDRDYPRWVAYAHLGGVRVKRMFGVRKYGARRARQLAIAQRLEWLEMRGEEDDDDME